MWITAQEYFDKKRMCEVALPEIQKRYGENVSLKEVVNLLYDDLDRTPINMNDWMNDKIDWKTRDQELINSSRKVVELYTSKLKKGIQLKLF